MMAARNVSEFAAALRSALRLDNQPTATPQKHWLGYSETLKLASYSGERQALPPANTRFVQMHFPEEDPIGRRIELSMDLAGGAAPTGGIPTFLTATIVGVVPNVRQASFDDAETDPVSA